MKCDNHPNGDPVSPLRKLSNRVYRSLAWYRETVAHIKAVEDHLEEPSDCSPTPEQQAWFDKGVAFAEARATANTLKPGWYLAQSDINTLVTDSLNQIIRRAKWAHMADVRLRENGKDVWFEADWIKYMREVK